MKTFKPYVFLLAIAVGGTLGGCSPASTRAASVSDSVRTSLDKASASKMSRQVRIVTKAS